MITCTVSGVVEATAPAGVKGRKSNRVLIAGDWISVKPSDVPEFLGYVVEGQVKDLPLRPYGYARKEDDAVVLDEDGEADVVIAYSFRAARSVLGKLVSAQAAPTATLVAG